MEPATLEISLDELPDLEQLLEAMNTPTAGPPVTVSVDGERAVFVCATWPPILRARVDDAIAAVG